MSSIDSKLIARVNPAPHVDVIAPKPAQSPDAMSKKIREVLVSTEQVSHQMSEQRTKSVENLSRLQARVDEAIRSLNESTRLNPNKLQFTVDEVSNRIMVVVTDEVTGETVRQVPAEALLRVSHNIEAMKGLLFDKAL